MGPRVRRTKSGSDPPNAGHLGGLLCCGCQEPAPIPYVQVTILNLPHPYLRSTTVLLDFKLAGYSGTQMVTCVATLIKFMYILKLGKAVPISHVGGDKKLLITLALSYECFNSCQLILCCICHYMVYFFGLITVTSPENKCFLFYLQLFPHYSQHGKYLLSPKLCWCSKIDGHSGHTNPIRLTVKHVVTMPQEPYLISF